MLATRATSGDEADAVQAFAVVRGAAVAVSGPETLPGPVTALWQSGEAGALAVVRNPAAGNYAAYVITVDCGS
jgi:predicted component of type VI protein secretion system